MHLFLTDLENLLARQNNWPHVIFNFSPDATTPYFHFVSQCRRQKKKLDLKFKNEQKALYQQYYEDVYSLQIQNAELIQALEQLGYKVSK